MWWSAVGVAAHVERDRVGAGLGVGGSAEEFDEFFFEGGGDVCGVVCDAPGRGGVAVGGPAVTRWRWSTGQVVCCSPVGSVQVTVPSGWSFTVQPSRCLMRWWRRHRHMRLIGDVGPPGQGADVVEVALACGHGAAGEATGSVAQPDESGHAVGHPVGLAEVFEVLAGAFGLAVSASGGRLTPGQRGGDVTVHEGAGAGVAGQFTFGVGGAGSVEPFTADERCPALPEPTDLDEVLRRTAAVSAARSVGARLLLTPSALQNRPWRARVTTAEPSRRHRQLWARWCRSAPASSAARVAWMTTLTSLCSRMSSIIASARANSRLSALPLAHELAGAFGHGSPRPSRVFDTEVAAPVVGAVFAGAAGQPAPGPLFLSFLGHRIRIHLRSRPGQQLPQRPNRQLSPHVLDPVHDLSRGLGRQELRLLRDDPGTVLIQVTPGHGVDHGRGAGHLPDRVQDPVRRHKHRTPQPGCRQLRPVQALVPQPVMDLHAGAVFLPVEVACGQVRQRDRLPGRRGVLLPLGEFDDVQEFLGTQPLSARAQRGIPALKGGGRGGAFHDPRILEREF